MYYYEHTRAFYDGFQNGNSRESWQQFPKRKQFNLKAPDNSIQLQVKLDQDTVWLTQEQMAILFQRDKSVIARHISNIYAEGELSRESTIAKIAIVPSTRERSYETTLYNLDVIISVGYRVKSQRGVQFRQWANKVLVDAKIAPTNSFQNGNSCKMRFARINMIN